MKTFYISTVNITVDPSLDHKLKTHRWKSEYWRFAVKTLYLENFNLSGAKKNSLVFKPGNFDIIQSILKEVYEPRQGNFLR